MDVLRREVDAGGLWVITAEGGKLAMLGVKQGEAGTFAAFMAGDQVDAVRDPCRGLRDAQCVERFGDDLRREAGDSEQDTVRGHDVGH